MCRLQTHIWKRVAVNATNCLLSACFNNQLQDDDVIIDAKSCQVGLRPLLLVRYIAPFRLQDWRYSRAQHLYHWLIAAFEFGFPLPTSLGSNYHIEPPISSCHHYFWPSFILTVSRASPLVILSIPVIWILIAEQKKKEERRKKMPCLYISTNVSLDGVDVDPIFADATRAVALIIGRPEHVR